MKIKMLLLLFTLPIILGWAISARAQNDEVKVANLQPVQSTNVPYRLFATRNTWTFLKLDTRTGLIWGVQFSLKEGQLSYPVNKKLLAPPSSSNVGRFTLYPTTNIFNFLLADQQTGRVWQVQWSQEEEKCGIWRITD